VDPAARLRAGDVHHLLTENGFDRMSIEPVIAHRWL